jgi:prepilin-type N-terminal cleavage/methylation domain-containing protein
MSRKQSRRESGFTLIELMIVIAIIAIIAAIAIPNLLAARLSANETAAIATLRNIVSAQAQFQQSGKADEDSDGTGEYGGFMELSGAVQGRLDGPVGTVLVPPVLSGGFRVLNANSEVTRSGYFFQMWLPDVGGAGVIEDPANSYTDGGGQDPDLSETTWCCYAWPVNYNQSGNRTFFTNQAGDVLGMDYGDNTYSGTGAGPADDAAFAAAGSITGVVDIGGAGQSGSASGVWRQVN